MTSTPNAPKAAAPAVAQAPPEWTARRSVDGLQVVIDSANFEHDALLILTGDFEDESTKLSYAGALADKLNGRLAAAPQQVAEPVAWMFQSITGGHVFYEGSTRPEGAPERAIPLYAACPSQASATGEV